MQHTLKYATPPEDIEAFRKADWRTRIYYAPIPPQIHALIAVMLDEEPRTPMYFTGKATVTSDGFVLCDFVDGDGMMRHGTFIGSFEEVQADVVKLIKALKKDGVLDDAEGLEVIKTFANWIGADHRRVN